MLGRWVVTMTDLSAEDTKLVTLARAAMARIGADHGAAVRDADGRSYAAAPVTLTTLSISGLDLALAQAVSAGASGIEAAAVVRSADEVTVDLAALREFAGAGMAVFIANPRGDVVEVLST